MPVPLGCFVCTGVKLATCCPAVLEFQVWNCPVNVWSKWTTSNLSVQPNASSVLSLNWPSPSDYTIKIGVNVFPIASLVRTGYRVFSELLCIPFSLCHPGIPFSLWLARDPTFFLVGFLLLMYLSNLQGATQTFLVLYLLLTFDLPCVL